MFYSSACAGEADIAFVVDSSGSIGLNAWRDIKNFLARVVSNMYINKNGVRVALVTYASWMELKFNFHQFTTKHEVVSMTGMFMTHKFISFRTSLFTLLLPERLK